MVEKSRARQCFGARVRAIRHARKLTLKQVGASLGLTETSMSRIERGNQNMGFDDIVQLADLLGVTPIDFFWHDSPSDSPTSLPGSGLELFKPLDAFPDYRLAACA